MATLKGTEVNGFTNHALMAGAIDAGSVVEVLFHYDGLLKDTQDAHIKFDTTPEQWVRFWEDGLAQAKACMVNRSELESKAALRNLVSTKVMCPHCNTLMSLADSDVVDDPESGAWEAWADFTCMNRKCALAGHTVELQADNDVK
jgi:hypothetical protein